MSDCLRHNELRVDVWAIYYWHRWCNGDFSPVAPLLHVNARLLRLAGSGGVLVAISSNSLELRLARRFAGEHPTLEAALHRSG